MRQLHMVFTSFCLFFFNDTATTEIYTLSLHDALPIWPRERGRPRTGGRGGPDAPEAYPEAPVRAGPGGRAGRDRKSTRLNSSHANISYAVFCLKKKKITLHLHRTLRDNRTEL